MVKDTSARAPADVSSARGDGASPRGKWIATGKKIVALGIVLIAGLSAWGRGTRPSCIDFYQFWVVGRAVGQHQARDVYTAAERQRLGELHAREALAAQVASATPDVPSKRIQAAQQRQVLETFSTPWMYTIFGFAASADYDGDQARFQTVSTLAFVLAIALFGHLLGYGPIGIALWVLIFTSSWFKPFSDEVIAGNVNRLQVAFLALFVWLASRERWKHAQLIAGFVLGAAILFKPNLAIVAVVLAIGWGITRQFGKLARQAIGVAIGALAAFGISCAYFGSVHIWIDWIRTIPELLAQGTSAGGNYAFSRLLLDRAGFSMTRTLPLELLVIIGIVLVRARSRQQKEVERDLGTADDRARDSASFDILLVGLGTTISVLTTDLVWLHYYLLCVPLAIFALRPERLAVVSGGRWALRTMACLGTSLVALQLFIRVFDIPRPSEASPYVNSGLLLLFFASLADLALFTRVPERAPKTVS
jgi:hypothetical protein